MGADVTGAAAAAPRTPPMEVTGAAATSCSAACGTETATCSCCCKVLSVGEMVLLFWWWIPCLPFTVAIGLSVWCKLRNFFSVTFILVGRGVFL